LHCSNSSTLFKNYYIIDYTLFSKFEGEFLEEIITIHDSIIKKA